MNNTEKNDEKAKGTDNSLQQIQISVDYLIDVKEEKGAKIFSVNEKRVADAVKTLNDGKTLLLAPFNKIVSSEFELRASVNEQIQRLKKKESKQGVAFGIIALVITGLIIWGIVAGIRSCSSDSPDGETSEKKGSIFSNLFGGSDPSSVSSADEAKEYLDGKTFIATPTDAVWTKVTFSGNSFNLWMAAPRDGKWGNPVKSGTYKIREDRFSSTGERYFYAEIVEPMHEGEDIHAALDRILKETSNDNYGDSTTPEQIVIINMVRMYNIDLIINDLTISFIPIVPNEQFPRCRYEANEGDKNPWN
ncbi:MAG: hypothetical protein LBC89_06670 [Bacteroidales bacterium]|jgi:hypothetical protein|nr:hypothetical protein [Bacteroidales bacterium]